MHVEDRSTREWHSGFGAAAGTAVLTAVLALLSPTAAFAETDPGSIGVRLIDVPAQSADDSRARQYIVDDLEPGTTIERRFEISNTTSEPVNVEVYPSAASIADGTFLGADGRSENDLTSRTTIREPSVVVPANSSVTDTVTIAIPSDASPGEQYGAIWVEARSETTADVQLVNRVGIRMYVSVGGSNSAASDFVIDSMTASRDDAGGAVVTATIRNTGGRAVDVTATLTLVKVGATLAAGPYSSTAGVTIAPGGTGRVPVNLTDEIDAGPWTATLEASSGALIVTANTDLRFPAAGDGHAVKTVPSGQTIPFWMQASLLGAGILLLAAAAHLAARRRSLRGRAWQETANAVRAPAATGERPTDRHAQR